MTDSSSSASSASSLSLCCAVSDSLSSWAETVVATLADCFIWTLVLALLEVSSSSLQLQSLLCMRFLRAHLLRALLLHFNFSGIRTRTYTCNLVDVHMLHVSHAPGSSSADLFLGMPRRYMLTPRHSQPKCARDGAAHLQLRRTSSSADLPLGVHGQYMLNPRHPRPKVACDDGEPQYKNLFINVDAGTRTCDLVGTQVLQNSHTPPAPQTCP
jgi:hypothetical protein